MADYTLSAKITGDAKSFQTCLANAENAVANFEKKIGGISAKFQSVGDKISKIGSKLTSTITKPAVAATSALTGVTLVKGFNRLTGIDDAKAKLKALGNTAKDTEEIMNSALASVKGTSFGMDEAATTAAGAVAAGVKPGQDLTKYLTMTADAAAIAGSSMADMGSIMNKVQTSQVAYTDNLNQLADRGIPIYQWIAKEAGKSSSAVKDMASEGEISSELFFKAIQKNIGGAAKSMGEDSFKSTLANIGASISRIGANFLDAGGQGGGFFSTVKPMLADFNTKLGAVEEKAKEWGVIFGQAFTGIVQYIKTGKTQMSGFSSQAQTIVSKIEPIVDAVKSLGNVLDKMKSKGIPIEKLAAGALALGPAMTMAGKATSIFGGAFSGISKVVGLFGSAVSGTNGVVSSFVGRFSSLAGSVNKAKVSIKALGSPMGGFLNTFKSFGSAFSGVLGVAKNFGGQFTSILMKAFGFGAIGGLVLVGLGLIQQNFGDKIGEILTMVQEKAPDIILGLVNGINSKIPKLISQGGKLVSSLISTITSLLPLLISSGANILTNLANGFASQLPNLILKVGEMIVTIIQSITQNLPQILTAGVNIISSLINGISQTIPQIITALVGMIPVIVETFTANLPTIINAGIQLIMSLVDGLIQAIPIIIDALPTIISSLVDGLLAAIPQIIEAGIQLFTSLVQALPEIINQIVSVLPQIITSIIDALLSNLPMIIQAGIDLLIALVNDLPTIITTIVESLPKIIMGIVNGLVDNIDKIIDAGIQLLVSLVTNIPAIIKGLVKAVPKIIKGLINAIIDFVPELGKAGLNLIKGLWNGIKDAGAWLWDKISGFFGGIVDKVKGFFGIHSPSTLFRDMIGKNLVKGIAVGFNVETPNLENSINKNLYDVKGNVDGFVQSYDVYSNRCLDGATSVNYGESVAKSYAGYDYDGTFNAVYSAVKAAGSGANKDIYITVPVYYDSQKVDEQQYKYNQRQLVRSNGMR